MADCCLCNGDLILIGQLGRTKQFRCRHCGMIFSAVRRTRQNLAKESLKSEAYPKESPTENNGPQSHKKNSDAASDAAF